MKPNLFRDQFIECKKNGLTKAGSLKKFKDHLELLPAPWHPAAPKFLKVLEKNPDAGLTPLLCLKFGGECNGGNEKCRELRGFK
jgi:hypothetical protein